MIKKIFYLLCLILFFISPSFASDIEVIKDGVGIYIIKVPLDKYQDKIKPYVSDELITSSDLYNNKDLNFKLVINGGYFDTITGLAVSNVVINKKEVQNLYDNTSLIKSLDETKRIQKVLDRSELRILSKGKKLVFDIAPHTDKIKEGYELIHSIQGGPMILPDLRMEEESFIAFKDNKSYSLAADVLKRRERTVVGLKEGLFGDYFYIIIFTKYAKMALNEVRDYCIKLGLTKALNMDGGASTSLNYEGIEVYSSGVDEGRKVKSFIVIEN